MKIVEILCLIIIDFEGWREGETKYLSLPPISPQFGHSSFHIGTNIIYPNTRCFGKITLGEKNNNRASIYSLKAKYLRLL